MTHGMRINIRLPEAYAEELRAIAQEPQLIGCMAVSQGEGRVLIEDGIVTDWYDVWYKNESAWDKAHAIFAAGKVVQSQLSAPVEVAEASLV